MKHFVYLLWLVVSVQSIGQTNQNPKSSEIPARIHTSQKQEPLSIRTPGNKQKPSTFAGLPGGTRVTSSGSTFTINTLGTSVNPYTIALYPQRQILDFDPKSNSVMLTRRGGIEDLNFSPSTSPGNALYYDVSIDGGYTWSTGLGPVYRQPANTGASENWLDAPRYPIGILVNPKKSSNPANVFGFFTTALIVDSDNNWGGETFGTRRVFANDTASLRVLKDSAIFKPDATAKNSRNEIFSIQREVDPGLSVPLGSNNILRINKVVIDTLTNQFIRTKQWIELPSPNPGLESTLLAANICFAKEGGHGYITVTGRLQNETVTPLPVSYLLVYHTQDFGQTWNGPFTADLTMDPDFANTRLLFKGDSSLDLSSGFMKRNYYTFLQDFDSEVDFQNHLHFFGSIATTPNDVSASPSIYYPSDLGLIHMSISPTGLTNSSWTVHTSKRTQSRFGFVGDPIQAGAQLANDFFPQIAFSEDRRLILLSHSDTDTTLHPPNGDFNYNNFPDLFVQKGRFTGSSWSFSTSENETKESDIAGKIFWPRLANTIKDRGDTIEFFVSTALMDDFTPNSDLLMFPIRHLVLHFNGKSILALNSVSGRVFEDKNGNCVFDSTDRPMANSRVQFPPLSVFTYTNSQGIYQTNLPQGQYHAKYVPLTALNSVHTTPCLTNGQTAAISFPTDSGGFLANLDLPVRIEKCAKIMLNSWTGILRPCRKSEYRALATNVGTDTAWNLKISVKLPSLIRLLSSTPSSSFNPIDSTYLFSIPYLAPFQKLSLWLENSVVCPASPQLLLGLNQCFLSKVTYENGCNLTNPLWDKVDIQTSGTCSSGGIQFKIKNTGLSMNQARPYSIFKDSLLVFQDSFLLPGGDSLILQVPNSQNSSVYRIQVPQSAHHPMGSWASSNARCFFPLLAAGASSEMGSEDLSESVSQTCEPIRTSYDPNDKNVWPKGAGEFGKTLPDSWLEYKIRFMNKGNDTAFTVVVIDTLSEHLDLESFQAGMVSHSHSIRVKAGLNPILTYTFNNIMLVDSITNTEKSNGFITFKIKPKANVPLGTEIRNRASIYFDFNDPILTNYTLNTLYRPSITPGIVDSVQIVTTSKPAVSNPGRFELFPNPNRGIVSVRTSLEGEKQLIVSDLMGKSLINSSFEGSSVQVDCSKLAKGTYFIRVVSEGRIQNGKLMVE